MVPIPAEEQLRLETAALICEVCSVDIGTELQEGKGEMSMCKAIEDMKEEAKQEGREEGREEGKLVNIITMTCRKLKKAMQPDEIAELLEEDYELIRRICEIAESCGTDDEAKIFDVLQGR